MSEKFVPRLKTVAGCFQTVALKEAEERFTITCTDVNKKYKYFSANIFGNSFCIKLMRENGQTTHSPIIPKIMFNLDLLMKIYVANRSSCLIG